MTQTEGTRQKIWAWIKSNRPQRPEEPFAAFTAQSICGSEDPLYRDALWQLATAGILRPDKTIQFTLTDWGKEAIRDDVSPYLKNELLGGVTRSAPLLNDDSAAYLGLALDCLYSVPAASVALTRVALELEIDSVIDLLIKTQDPGQAPRKKLSSRDLSVRIGELIGQLRDRGIQAPDDIKLFEAYITQVRVNGNRMLHPGSAMPDTDPLSVRSVIHAFRSFAAVASTLKAEWASVEVTS